MNHRFTSSLLVPFMLGACGGANPPSSDVPSFADLDRDNDGFLSRTESAEVEELANIFTLADVDQDGQLSVAEFSKATIEGTTVSAEAAGGPPFGVIDGAEEE